MTNKSILDGWEKELNKVLLGIDKDTIETPDGWWETSTGVEFGTKKLEELKSFISSLLQAQREKDKERLLEGVKEELLKYDISGRHYLIEQLNKVINEIYGN